MFRIKKNESREDTYRHKGMRRRLVRLLEEKGIQDSKVLAAINKIPRHFLANSTFAEQLYEDKAFPIEADQTISQPFTVAFMTELLSIERGQKVLEIGTGSGYQAWVLQELGAEVHSIERQEELYQKTAAFFDSYTFENFHLYLGDGTKGLQAEAPFDRMIVTAGAPVVPEELLEQLSVGGILIIPVGEDEQVMYRYIKLSETKFDIKKFGAFRFVPVLKGIAPWKK